MRLAAVVVMLCACSAYDPVAEIAHREVATTGDAVHAILAQAGRPRVYAIGEYHPQRQSDARSPLARFTSEVVTILGPRADHFVVEAWLDDSCNGSTHEPVGAQVSAVTGRQPSTTSELAQLITTTTALGLQNHGLPVTCIEQTAVLDGRGRVDFYRLLVLVTEKLGETTRRLVAEGRDVIVYGGALHNDLHPRWALEELTYAQSLAADLGGGVLEIDLVVPEVVAPMAIVRLEPWFPLLARASPERVILWRRAPNSYVVILPAVSEEVSKVAKLAKL